MINFGLLGHIASYPSSDSGEAIRAVVACQVRNFGFRNDGEAARKYYDKVATFLEDGWQSQKEYCNLRGDVLPQDFGAAINRLVGGHRFDRSDAEKTGAPWLGAGVWPTRLDCAAFLYYSAQPQRGQTAVAA